SNHFQQRSIRNRLHRSPSLIKMNHFYYNVDQRKRKQKNIALKPSSSETLKNKAKILIENTPTIKSERHNFETRPHLYREECHISEAKSHQYRVECHVYEAKSHQNRVECHVSEANPHQCRVERHVFEARSHQSRVERHI